MSVGSFVSRAPRHEHRRYVNRYGPTRLRATGDLAWHANCRLRASGPGLGQVLRLYTVAVAFE